MGLAKAGLKTTVRDLVGSAGSGGIRMNGISASPNVVSTAALLLSDMAFGNAGETTYVDDGFNAVAGKAIGSSVAPG